MKLGNSTINSRNSPLPSLSTRLMTKVSLKKGKKIMEMEWGRKTYRDFKKKKLTDFS